MHGKGIIFRYFVMSKEGEHEVIGFSVTNGFKGVTERLSSYSQPIF